MRRKGNLVRYTADELKKLESKPVGPRSTLRPERRSRSRPKRTTGPLPEGWEDTVVLGIPGPKRGVYLRLDPDVLD
jgi:hypothetical protein